MVEPMDFWKEEGAPPEDYGDTDFRIRLQFERLAAIHNHKQGK